MKKPSSVKELCEFIWYLENKYDLFNLEIDGVKPWLLNRIKIYYDLGKKAGFMKVPHNVISKKIKILNFFNYLKSAIFKNPFYANEVDFLIFSHPRVRKIDGEIIDMYTYYFINDLLKNNKNFIEIESPYLGKHLKRNEKWRYHNDFFIICKKIFYKFINIKNVDINLIKKVEKEIQLKIGTYDLLNLFIKTTKEFKIEYFLYKKLLKKLKPKQIYLVVSYSGFGPLIKAAKDLSIEVLEFQHGNFSKYHLGYYFGETKKDLDYFPDKFLVWNEYWKNLIKFPIKDENIIIRKFDYLEKRKNLYKHIKKYKNQAVVLSQGVLGDKIAKKILDNWEYFKNFNIKYKLHPGEYGRWKNYPNLMKLSRFDNVEVLEEVDLYRLFSESEYQIGVFSTALYEGIEFNCKTILLNLPGIEKMDLFQKKYNVFVI